VTGAALGFAALGNHGSNPCVHRCASLRARRVPAVANDPSPSDNIEALLTEKVVSGDTKRKRGPRPKAPRPRPSSAKVPRASPPKPTQPKSASPPKPSLEGLRAAAGPLAETAAAPAAALGAFAAVRSSLVSAKAKREAAQRRAQEEADRAKPLPQAGVLPVYNVPSILGTSAAGAARAATKTVAQQSQKLLPAEARERAAALRRRTDELNREASARAAALKRKQIALMNDRENKVVGELGKSLQTTAGRAAKKVKEAKNLPSIPLKKGGPGYTFPKADLWSDMNQNTAVPVAATAGAAGLLAIFAAARDGAPARRAAPARPQSNTAEETTVGEEVVPIVPAPSPPEAASAAAPATEAMVEAPPSTKAVVAEPAKVVAPAARTTAAATAPTKAVVAGDAPSDVALLPAKVPLTAGGSLVLLAVALRTAGEKRRAAEAAREKALRSPPTDVAEDEDDGKKTSGVEMTADASDASTFVQSIRRQIADVDAALASFTDDEVKVLLARQKEDLEDMLRFALDNDL